MILVDQADKLTNLQQSDLRSKLDGSEKLGNVIWIFTAARSGNFDEGFNSRCRKVQFSSYGSAPALAEHLRAVWHSETQGNVLEPNFTRMIKEAKGNMLLALGELQHHLTDQLSATF